MTFYHYLTKLEGKEVTIELLRGTVDGTVFRTGTDFIELEIEIEDEKTNCVIPMDKITAVREHNEEKENE